MNQTSAHNCICQSCNKIFPVNKLMVCSFNFDTDLDTSKAFLEYSLNKVTCTSCKKSFTFEMPMIVYSEKFNFAIYVRPSPDTPDNHKSRPAPTHLIPHKMRYRECMYQAEAVEKCKIFKDGLDDRIIEFIKLHYFEEKDTLPFDEINMVYKSSDNEYYYFEKIDYNNTLLTEYKIPKPEANILCRGISFTTDDSYWHTINRKTVKENVYD